MLPNVQQEFCRCRGDPWCVVNQFGETTRAERWGFQSVRADVDVEVDPGEFEASDLDTGFSREELFDATCNFDGFMEMSNLIRLENNTLSNVGL